MTTFYISLLSAFTCLTATTAIILVILIRIVRETIHANKKYLEEEMSRREEREKTLRQMNHLMQATLNLNTEAMRNIVKEIEKFRLYAGSNINLN